MDNRKTFKIHINIRIVTCTSFPTFSNIQESYTIRLTISAIAMHCPIKAIPKLTQKFSVRFYKPVN